MAIPQVTNPKLEAVNIMLSCIGESPVNSLVSGLADAEAAELILNRISKEAQTEGWHFNTRITYTLPVDEADQIPVPTNTLRLNLADTSRGYPLTQRGSRLYDYEENSYTVGVTYPTVKVNLVEQLAFNEDSASREAIPEYMRRYISIRAARVFIGRNLGSENIYGFTSQDEALARAELKQAEGRAQQFSIFDHYTKGENTLYTSYNRLI